MHRNKIQSKKSLEMGDAWKGFGDRGRAGEGQCVGEQPEEPPLFWGLETAPGDAVGDHGALALTGLFSGFRGALG